MFKFILLWEYRVIGMFINNHNQRLMRFNRIKKQALNKLELMDITNIFGAQQSDSLTFKLPTSQVSLNRSLIKEIGQMKVTAANYRMLYLTANQVQNLNRVFVINKNFHLGTHTNEAYGNPSDFQAYINPVIKQTQGQQQQVQQSCLVIPFIKFIVSRYKTITLQYRNEGRDYLVQNITGQLSYWIQHCINHLDGELLFQYKLSNGRFCVHKDVAVSFPKTSFLLKEYSLRLKNHHQKVSKGQVTLEDDKFIKMKQEYMQRLKYQYHKQNTSFSLKFQEKKVKII